MLTQTNVLAIQEIKGFQILSHNTPTEKNGTIQGKIKVSRHPPLGIERSIEKYSDEQPKDVLI